MTAVEAYDLAVETWGALAAVWSPGAGRFVVGVWAPDGTLLRTKRHGVRVLGVGRSWEQALTAAGAP